MKEKNSDLITVYKGGKAIEVTRKAFNVHYVHNGYTLKPGGKKESYTIEDLQGMTEKELNKVTNDQYKELFDSVGIKYEEDATKKDFIKLIPNE